MTKVLPTPEKEDSMLDRMRERLVPDGMPVDDRGRMRMVVDSLILHLHPTKVVASTMNWTYNWSLGGLSALLMAVLGINRRCHGLEGQGTPRAPALNVKSFLTDTSDLAIQQIVTNGVPGTAMPVWGDRMTESDIQAIVGFIRQWEATALEVAVPAKGGGGARRGCEITHRPLHNPARRGRSTTCCSYARSSPSSTNCLVANLRLAHPPAGFRRIIHRIHTDLYGR